jgi:predicted DsbA family dithiol-disulfide isomerase
VADVHATYYTDPACPGSWALEPVLRRLAAELGSQLHVRHVMGGLAREFGPPLPIVGAWLDAADASGMPVDPRLWVDHPPRSSYPACMAVKAAGEQGAEIEAAYLRRLREGWACGRRRLDSADALTTEAREVHGLDVGRFEVDLRSHGTVERFGADLDVAADVDAAQQAEGSGRVRLPSLEFRGADQEVHGVYGGQPYEAYRAAAEAAGASFGELQRPTVEEALRRFGRMATPEVAAVCHLAGPRAAAELWRLTAEWRVRADRRLSGELWSLA